MTSVVTVSRTRLSSKSVLLMTTMSAQTELLLEQLFQRTLVFQCVIVLALGLDRLRVGGEQAVGHRRSVDHRHHRVDGHPGPDVGPVERLDQRLGHGETRGFYDDLVQPLLAAEQRLHGGHEIVGHRAADASVGQLENVLVFAALDAAPLEDLAVDAHVAELVDDELAIRRPPAFSSRCRMMLVLPAPRKSGDHRRRYLLCHVLRFLYVSKRQPRICVSRIPGGRESAHPGSATGSFMTAPSPRKAARTVYRECSVAKVVE